MSEKTHDFYIVDPSPMPLLSTIAATFLACGFIAYIAEVNGGIYILGAGLMSVLACMFFWWRDVIKESYRDKCMTPTVQAGMRLGMTLFIVSELMFFFAFFWSFFKVMIFPADIINDETFSVIAAGASPPASIETADPWDIPYLNTLILLLSGTTVTWAHHALLHGDRKGLVRGLLFTVILGVIFTYFQIYEYGHLMFKISDGSWASNFYMATGFHGFHVLVGTIFLFVCYLRAKKGQMDEKNHLGFEFAAWYWHFVDVVWLFLFVCVYIWGR